MLLLRLSIFALVLSYAGPCWSVTGKLVVAVTDLEETPIGGLILTVAGSSSTSRPTEQKSGRIVQSGALCWKRSGDDRFIAKIT